MGISDWFAKKPGAGTDNRRSEHTARLMAHIEGAAGKAGGIPESAREDIERLGDAMFEVQVTTAGVLTTFSTREDVAGFVRKYNSLLAQTNQ